MVIIIKYGDTFSLDGVARDSAGTSLNLTGYALTSQLRKTASDELYTALDVAVADQDADPGVFKLSTTATLPASTSFVCDVKIVDPDGNVTHTPTFEISIAQAVTR